MRSVEQISNLRTIYGCLVSSEVDFLSFCPAWQHVAPLEVKSYSVQGWGMGPQKTNNFLNFGNIIDP